MRTKNLTRYPFGAKACSRQPPQAEMMLVARAAFALRPNQPLVPLEELDHGYLSADTYAHDDLERAGECLYPGDFADFKPGADLLLRGTCHVPGGAPAAACRVAFGVGAWSKSLTVVGDRWWGSDEEGAPVSDAQPFTAMPLDYAHSFGGPGFPANPVGKGHVGSALPNVLYPEQPRLRPGDRPYPAGFGPVNPAWWPRADKVGTQYGEDYRKTRAPYYAADFDWSHFNAAPLDQQLAAYLVGDELLQFENLHPEAPLFSVPLPGIRLRAFVNDEEGRQREVAMNLDTLYADLDQGLLWLTWRGVDAVATDDMSDVTTLLLAEESLAGPAQPAEHYYAKIDVFEADPLGLDELDVEVPDFLRQEMAVQMARLKGEPPPPPPKLVPDPGLDPVSALLAKELGGMVPEAQAKIRTMIAEQTEQLKKSNIDLHAVLADALARQKPSPPIVVPQTPGEMPKVKIAYAMRAALEVAERNKDFVEEHGRSADLAKVYELARDPRLQELDPGYDPEATLAAAKRDAAEPLAPPENASIPNITAPPGVSPAAGSAAPAMPLGPIAAAPHLVAPEPGTFKRDLRGTDLRGADLRQEDYAQCDLAAAKLAGADLRGVDLSGANLAGAVLQGANLMGANLSEAVLEDTDLSGANLASSSLHQARATRANFSGATMKMCGATELVADDAVFDEAILEQALFSEASLRGARFHKIDAKLTLFQKARLLGADFSGAKFLLCDFEDAELRDASFAQARLDTVSFLLAQLMRTSFQGAELVKCGFRLAHMRRTSFYSARGKLNVFDKGRFEAADFRLASLIDSQFIEANASHTWFGQANLPGARFYKAQVRECSFQHANLMSADFRKCLLENSDFGAANLYDGKLLNTTGSGCSFEGTNMKRVQRNDQ